MAKLKDLIRGNDLIVAPVVCNPIMAKMAEARGGGPARFHETASSVYTPSPERGFDFPLTGADVITDANLIRAHFPYLAPETVALAHA